MSYNYNHTARLQFSEHIACKWQTSIKVTLLEQTMLLSQKRLNDRGDRKCRCTISWILPNPHQSLSWVHRLRRKASRWIVVEQGKSWELRLHLTVEESPLYNSMDIRDMQEVRIDSSYSPTYILKKSLYNSRQIGDYDINAAVKLITSPSSSNLTW